jgi:DTW domain-containing protein YfiP
LNLEQFFKQRQEYQRVQPVYRNLCTTCLQPEFGCFCRHIQTFDSKIKFVILIHPIEAKRRIATGRMSHLCLRNSELLMGQDYTADSRVNAILGDPKNQCIILYPGAQSLNLTSASMDQKKALFCEHKKPVVFVIDGTWATAGKMIRQSQNLIALPRIGFTPPGPSHFRVRKQPSPECYSTIEAIHQTIELLGESLGFATSAREHDKLLFVFNKMVEKQLDFIRRSDENPSPNRYRRPRSS